MFNIIHFILALSVITILAIFISNDRKNIRFRFIFQLLTIEIVFAYFFLHSHISLNFVQNLSIFFNKLLSFTTEGTNFVFSNMNKQGLALFFLNVLCPIIFISALIGILQYIRILPFIIRIIGTLLSKINGMGKLESFNAISSLILGQSENFILYKDIISTISELRLYTMAAMAMSTVSISIIGTYMTILIPKYVITAVILNIFSSFIVLSLINPYQVNQEEDIEINYLYKKQNFFEMLNEYILIGFKIAIIVTAMLIGFIALISAINTLFNVIFNITFQSILGYICFPIAWIIGIPTHEAVQAGSIMATKLVANEFIAMLDLQKIVDDLSARSVGILSVFLVSFANFSSIGIITGTIKSLNKHQGNIISKYSLKLVYSSTLVSLLSAAITGLVI